MKKKVLWLVVARAGSKTIPNKNIKLLGNYPLLSYRIRSALNTQFENEVWISTDSEAYAKIANKYGAKSPFIRPKELANDKASSMDVVLHAMDFAKRNDYVFDYIGLLEPTSPFISSIQLDAAIKALEKNVKSNAIVAVKESRPHKMFIQEDNVYLEELAMQIREMDVLGRQFFKKQITPSGGFYISRWNDFILNKTFYTNNTMSFEVDEIGGLEIDEPIDWLFASFVVEKKLFDVTNLF